MSSQDSTSSPRKPEFKAKGHDSVLQKAQDGKKTVHVLTNSGNIYVGTLIARDRYTLSINIDGQPRVVFKSSIESFTVAN